MSHPPRKPDPSQDSLLFALKMGQVPASKKTAAPSDRIEPDDLGRGTHETPVRPDPLNSFLLPGGFPPMQPVPPIPGRRPMPHPGRPRPMSQRIPAVHSMIFKDWGVPEWFIVSQALLFAMLFIPGASAVRLLTKIASFFTSLLAFYLVYRKGNLKERSASFKPGGMIIAILVLLCMMFAHPGTNSPVSGLASIILWTSVYCVAFWSAAALRYGYQLQRVFMLIFLINSLSALLGIGQFYRPGTFLPPSIGVLEAGGMGALIPYYTTDDGRQVLRPCGMSDTPGMASFAGAMAAIMGLVVLTSNLPKWQRWMGLSLAIPGATVIYLTQVRTAILMVVVSLMALVFVMILQNRWTSVVQIAISGMIVVVGGFAWAAREGGKSITDRYFTLLDGSPTEVLGNSSRAALVSETFSTQIYEIPLGAGLGRYGQVYGYFGNWAYGDMIWVETQPAAWLVDGGIFLLFLGFATTLYALYDSLNVARFCPSPSIRHWAAGVFALNVSVFFSCFGQMPFLTNTGQQFWLLAAMTHAADRWVRYQQRRGLRVP